MAAEPMSPPDSAQLLSDQDVLTQGPRYNQPAPKTRVKWYRCPVPREELSKLNKRSDFLGFAQTLGFLGVLALGVGAAIYSQLHWPWYVTLAIVFVNGHFWHFIINGFHELVHDSVFRTQGLNWFFLRVLSFLGWWNHHHFWASHTEHHKYTLHPPDDQEVLLPYKIPLDLFWKLGIVNIKYPYDLLKGKFESVTGRFPSGGWMGTLFPASDPQRRRAYTRWQRLQLFGHLAIAGVALWFGLWVVPLVVTFPMMFGGWLHLACNSTQHTGLKDNVPDFRLCCRTIYLNPFLQFLYWHMNYHTEHHMYAAVPCYRLGRLHRIIKKDMPHCPNGLWETWKLVAAIQKRQETEPGYAFVAELP